MSEIVVKAVDAGLVEDWLRFFDHDAFANDPDLAVPDAEQVGSIVCSNVARPFRRQGIAGRLLEAAVAGFHDEGLRIAEAYTQPGGRRPDDRQAWGGSRRGGAQSGVGSRAARREVTIRREVTG